MSKHWEKGDWVRSRGEIVWRGQRRDWVALESIFPWSTQCDWHGAAIDETGGVWVVGLELDLRSALLWESSDRVVWGVEMVWSDNMNGNDFMGVLGYFTVKGEKHFNWLNLLVQPNTQVLRKSISGSNLKPKQTQPKLQMDRGLCIVSIMNYMSIWYEP